MTIWRHWKILLSAACGVLFLAVLLTAFPKTSEALAEGGGTESYTIYSYNITCVVGEDSSADVTETVTLSYDGRFTRNIPTDGKTRLEDVRLYEADGEGGYTEPDYFVTSGKNSATVKAETYGGSGRETFVITYRLVNLPLSRGKTKDTLYIVNLGAGWESGVPADKVSLELCLPEGFRADESSVFHGTRENPDADAAFRTSQEGVSSKGLGQAELYYDEDAGAILYTPSSDLKADAGMSFWLLFDGGVLSPGTGNFLPWLLLLVGLAIAAAAVTVRLTVFKKRETPKFNRAGRRGEKNLSGTALGKAASGGSPEPPFDPLTCRRVLSRKAEDGDVAVLIFHWAEKGYIAINPKKRDNPTLIKRADTLPTDAPECQKALFAALFYEGDKVTVRTAGRRARTFAQAVKKEANKKKEAEYSKGAVALGSVVAVLAAAFASCLPALLPMRVSSHAFSPAYFLTALPALLIFVFFAAVYATRERRSKKFTAAIASLSLAYSVAFVAAYCVFVPSEAFGLVPKIMAALLTFVSEIAAASFVMRTEKYDEKFGETEKTRDFILNTPRGEAEKIAEKDPGAYYKLLPYALALRVGVTWSDKFAGTSLPAPSWLVTDEKLVRFDDVRDTIRDIYGALLSQIALSDTHTK